MRQSKRSKIRLKSASDCNSAVTRAGYQFRAGFLDGVKREVITIYEILRDAANNLLYAVPDYQFR